MSCWGHLHLVAWQYRWVHSQPLENKTDCIYMHSKGFEFYFFSDLTYLTNPFCSGIPGCCVDIPARKQVDPLRLAWRTFTKSLGPTTFPGVSAETSWVIIVSWPIFWRICEGAKVYSKLNISRQQQVYFFIVKEDCV